MDQQIYQLCNWHLTPQGKETLTARCNCRNSLKEVINPIFADYSVIEYGSTRLKLDQEYSDLDIALVPYVNPLIFQNLFSGKTQRILSGGKHKITSG